MATTHTPTRTHTYTVRIHTHTHTLTHICKLTRTHTHTHRTGSDKVERVRHRHYIQRVFHHFYVRLTAAVLGPDEQLVVIQSRNTL